MGRKLICVASLILLLWQVGGASAAVAVVPIQSVTAASNSAQSSIYVTNNSGMTGDLHDSSYFTLWMSAVGTNGGGAGNPHPGTYNPGAGHWTWIKFEFGQIYSLEELWVWNYNEWTVRGLKNVVIEYTSDGTSWQTLGSYQFARAPTDGTGHGFDNYAHNTTIDFGGVQASAVIITTEQSVGNGNWGDSVSLFGLSEARFYSIPNSPNASDPNPIDGAQNVISTKILKWEAGSHAANVNGHDVYLGTNFNLVANANQSSDEFMGRQTATSYNPGGLELGQGYFWRIDEVDGQSSVLTGAVWIFTVNVKDQELVLKHLNRGVTLDRQFHTIPGPGNIMTILPIDIQIIKSMGFDHIKLLVNPALFKSGSTINSSNMWYVDEMVNVVLDEGLSVVVCIHPEHTFKLTVLGDWNEFQDMLGFYEDFSAYMAARWDPNELAFQLMTEPTGNAWDWNVMQPLMWQAVRNGMPDHTLILTGDALAVIEGLINVVPVDDINIIYCFGFYEPFIFTFSGGPWAWAYIDDLQHVPWPSNPTIIAERMADMLTFVPPGEQAQAATALTAYGNENWNKDNLLNYRLQAAVDWAENNGGQKLWVTEWGVYYGTIYPDERYQYIRDARELLEEYGVGWAYWSYNETQTLLDPSVRVPFSKSPSTSWIDEEMLNALGLLCGQGDINCDNTVDGDDLAFLINQWLQPPDTPPYADIAPVPNGDGIVNFLDWTAVNQNWLEDVTP